MMRKARTIKFLVSLLKLDEHVSEGFRRLLRDRLGHLVLAPALLAGILILGGCAQGGSNYATEAQEVVEEYFSAIQSGDLDRARSYWTDFNNPGGNWTLVAQRDMEHVTRDHVTDFAGGFEIVKSKFEAIEGLTRPIGVLRLDVRVQPEGKIKKLEIGLVRHEERWYIYSMYPGDW